MEPRSNRGNGGRAPRVCASARIDLGLGTTALEVDGNLGTARKHFMRAALTAVNSEDDDLLGRAVLGWNGLWVHENRGVVDALLVRTWRQRAMQRLPSSSQTAKRLAVRDAAEVDYGDGSVARVGRLLDEAQQTADVLLVAEALNLCHHCMLGPEHAERRLSIADELIALGATEGRRIDLLMGVVWRTVDLVLLGDPHADRAVSELERMASHPDHSATLYLVSALKVMQMIRSGHLDDAERAAAACFERGEEVGDADALGWYGAQLCSLRWYQGRSAELIPLISELVSSQTLASTNEAYLAALAVAAADAGELEEALIALRRLRGPSLSNLRPSSTWLVALFGAAIAAHELHDRDVAVEVRELLAPYAERPVMASLGVTCFGSAHYPLALAALTLGDTDGARLHLEAAIRHNQTLGNLPATRIAQRLLESHVASRADGRPTPVSCTRVDGQWQISLGTRDVRVPDWLGMRYLAVLLARPGVEVSAIELSGRPTDAGTPQPVLDGRAVLEYRHRMERLREEMADAADDDARLDRAQREYDALVDELARGHGLAGRARNFASADERARTSVQKALKRVLAKIRADDPVIGDIIGRHLVTGFVCCYRR
ncbi:hypothetical protein KV097_07235 [Mumia sp. zg.B17]|nr:hypothetical protein [Mumia sp. zg.B17]